MMDREEKLPRSKKICPFCVYNMNLNPRFEVDCEVDEDPEDTGFCEMYKKKRN
jgi:hypothetical protein